MLHVPDAAPQPTLPLADDVATTEAEAEAAAEEVSVAYEAPRVVSIVASTELPANQSLLAAPLRGSLLPPAAQQQRALLPTASAALATTLLVGCLAAASCLRARIRVAQEQDEAAAAVAAAARVAAAAEATADHPPPPTPRLSSRTSRVMRTIFDGLTVDVLATAAADLTELVSPTVADSLRYISVVHAGELFARRQAAEAAAATPREEDAPPGSPLLQASGAAGGFGAPRLGEAVRRPRRSSTSAQHAEHAPPPRPTPRPRSSQTSSGWVDPQE